MGDKEKKYIVTGKHFKSGRISPDGICKEFDDLSSANSFVRKVGYSGAYDLEVNEVDKDEEMPTYYGGYM